MAPQIVGHLNASLQWRYDERGGVSNHQRLDCLLDRLFRRRSKKHQGSASLVFVRGIQRWPVNSPHKGPVTRKCFHLMTSSCCLFRSVFKLANSKENKSFLCERTGVFPSQWASYVEKCHDVKMLSFLAWCHAILWRVVISFSVPY